MNDKLIVEQSTLAPATFKFRITAPTIKLGPPFWTRDWHTRLLQDHTNSCAPHHRKDTQSAMIRKIGQHPLMIPVREWVKAQSGGKWVDAIKRVRHHADGWHLDSHNRNRFACLEVHLTFESEQLAMLFKLAWVGV